MAKELPNTNDPPDVFQLFNSSRTFYFESDISSLPMPPATVAPPTQPQATGLRKSLSQPHLVFTSSSSGSCVVSDGKNTTQPSRPTSADLQLPAAVMARTAMEMPPAKYIHSDTASDSLETRYQTEPAYASSSILRSFQHEMTHFNQAAGSDRKVEGSRSNPASPRRGSEGSILSLLPPEPRPRTTSDPRKLSLVREEGLDQLSETATEPAAVAPLDMTDQAVTSAGRMAKLPGVGAVGSEGAALKGNKLSLTSQVAGWFTTPQKHVVNRTEINAFSPSSF